MIYLVIQGVPIIRCNTVLYLYFCYIRQPLRYLYKMDRPRVHHGTILRSTNKLIEYCTLHVIILKKYKSFVTLQHVTYDMVLHNNMHKQRMTRVIGTINKIPGPKKN